MSNYRPVIQYNVSQRMSVFVSQFNVCLNIGMCRIMGLSLVIDVCLNVIRA